MSDSAIHISETASHDFEQSSRVVADTASDAIITINEDSIMLFVNRAAEKIFGYARAEMIGQSLTMLMPDYLRHVHRAGLHRYLTTGQRHISWEAVQLPGLHKDGRELPLELSFGEFSENGRRFFTGIARDITERRKLERRLETQFQVARILAESESLARAAPLLLQAIAESLGWEMGQLWSLEREAHLLHWLASWQVASLDAKQFEEASRSRTFTRGVGLPGRIWANGEPEWITDIAVDTNFPRVPFALAAGLRSAFGFPILLGSEVSGVMEFFSREIQTSDQLLLDLMNSVGNQIGQFVERKRAEEERAQIFEREQRARHEVEIAMDRMRQVQTVTEVALAHLSLDKLLAELLDRVRDAMDVDTVAILLLENDNELVAWATKGLELDVQIRVPLGSGFAGRVAEKKSPMVIDDIDTADLHTPFLKERGVRSLLGVPLLLEGRVLGVIHVGRLVRRPFTEDDTRLLQLVAFRVALAIDHARLFEEEREARREAEAASRAKDEFLTIISHELRTPLTPIIGWVHMIRSEILPSKETKHGLSVIEKNSHTMKRLINDLLDMSAILSGKMRMDELPVNLEGVVREAVETVGALATARNIHVEVAFRDWHDESVNGDRARLLQVFLNLLDNAIKFSTPGGNVRIACEANGGDVIIRVEDSGQGITTDFLPFVFERFRQADGSRTRAHGGLGLGLSLVKSFVEAHKGSVVAESDGANRGSRFTVRLPRQRPHLVSAHRDEHPIDTHAQTTGAHLLIVEDDADTREILQATLEARGFQVTACESAAAALEEAAKNSIDLIVSDIGMPEMDGLEMMRQLRSVPGGQDLPTIAVTGYASKKDSQSALAAGYNAHVSKPVDPAELIRLIDRLLKNNSD
jgi:PAS domain S-box-containing protein